MVLALILKGFSDFCDDQIKVSKNICVINTLNKQIDNEKQN